MFKFYNTTDELQDILVLTHKITYRWGFSRLYESWVDRKPSMK